MRLVSLFLVLAAWLLPASSHAQEGASPLMSLVEAERAFARTTGEVGMKQGFLAYLHDESVLFRPDPVSGKEWTAQSPDRPGLLQWYPIAAGVVGSGELGYTTGPWTFRQTAGEDPVGYGHYVSVWKRDTTGTWKLLLDVGITNPPPAKTAPPTFDSVSTGTILAPLPLVAAAARRALSGLDSSYSEAVSEYEAGELGALASTEVRLYRTGFQPVAGLDTVRTFLQNHPEELATETLGLDVSRAGDFGYTYGRYKRMAGNEPENGYYLRIWKREDGTLRVVVDVLSPKQE